MNESRLHVLIPTSSSRILIYSANDSFMPTIHWEILGELQDALRSTSTSSSKQERLVIKFAEN